MDAGIIIGREVSHSCLLWDGFPDGLLEGADCIPLWGPDPRELAFLSISVATLVSWRCFVLLSLLEA